MGGGLSAHPVVVGVVITLWRTTLGTVCNFVFFFHFVYLLPTHTSIITVRRTKSNLGRKKVIHNLVTQPCGQRDATLCDPEEDWMPRETAEVFPNLLTVAERVTEEETKTLG